MPTSWNSVSYLAMHLKRIQQVRNLLRIAQSVEGHFAKYGCYLLLTNLNMSVSDPSYLTDVPDITPDVVRNKKARDVEMNEQEQYVLREEFVEPLDIIVDEANRLLDSATDLTKSERAFIVMFMGLCGQIESGELFPGEIEKEINVLKKAG